VIQHFGSTRRPYSGAADRVIISASIFSIVAAVALSLYLLAGLFGFVS
jgi:hypothetical protein